MRLLLDTHILVWLLYKPEALSAKAAQWLRQDGLEAYASTASLWEIAIKNGKFHGRMPPVATVRKDMAQSNIRELPIQAEVLPSLETLPLHHHDPFDRLLVATAFAEPMHLITHDSTLAAYDPTGKIVVVC